MKQVTARGNVLAYESAARKFAVAGAIGLGVLASSERNAGAQAKVAEQPPYEPMPVHVLGGRKQAVVDSEAGSFTFNSRALRVLMGGAMAGLSLDKAGDSSIAIGPSFETFIGYGTYRGPLGYVDSNMMYTGHSYGLGAIVRMKATINGNPAELMGYGNASYRVYDEYLRIGTTGGVQHLGDSGMHMGQAGLELRMPINAKIGIRNLGIGMLSDPRNAFMFVSLYAKYHESRQFSLGTAVTPHASMMLGDFSTGLDLLPIELVMNRDALRIATGPGLKYEYNTATHASAIAPYMGADATIGKKAGTHVNISLRSGYLTDAGPQRALPGGMFGGLQAGIIF